MLTKGSGSAGFDRVWSVNISRAADYLLHVWLRVKTPAVTLLPGNQYGADGRIHWCKNFMHNLNRECSMTANDLIIQKFDNYFLDFWAAFTTPASKKDGYNNMIGNIDTLLAPHAPGVPLPSKWLNLPLPFFFTRDTGVALPTSALPYNELRLNFQFRPWRELLVLENSAPVLGVNPYKAPNVPTDIANEPVLDIADVWANYAIVSVEERSKMGCAPRNIMIEQVQTAPSSTYNTVQNRIPRFDIRFSHSVKVLFFAAENITTQNIKSNYTSASPVPGPVVDNYTPSNALDPIESTTLTYENTDRLTNMGSDFFSLIEPWYKAPTIPFETGLHKYGYSLAFYEIDSLGSTNYGRLSNVALAPYGSDASIVAINGTGGLGSGADYAQKFQFITLSVASNVITVKNGIVGFPTI
jgi:hypothetical protein